MRRLLLAALALSAAASDAGKSHAAAKKPEPGNIHNTHSRAPPPPSPAPPPGHAKDDDDKHLTQDHSSLVGLFNTLFTTFGVIALGYVSRRTGFFSRDAKAGMSELVGKVALPALLFQAIATLKISDLKPEFIVGVLISKTLLWVMTAVSAGIAGRTLSDAAMWAIFISNSNDLAQGYPLFLTLYPEYAYQLFITAALQVAILNPFAILLLEIDTARRTGQSTSICTLVMRVVVQVARNPLVLMVFLGGVANVLWRGDPPTLLTGPLGIFTILGSTFTGAALFLTGYVSARPQSHVSLATPIYLTVLKSLIYPMMCRILVGKCAHVLLGVTPDPKLLDLAFLYGTMPTAPSTIVIAQAHGADPETIATAAVLNMVVSAPLSFLSTVLMTVSRLDLLEQAVTLISDVCCVGSAVCAAWVLACSASAATGLAQKLRRTRAAAAELRGVSPVASPRNGAGEGGEGGEGEGGVEAGGEGGGHTSADGGGVGGASAESGEAAEFELAAAASAARLHVTAHLAAAQLLFSLSHVWCQTHTHSPGSRAAWPISVFVHTGRTACAAWTVLFAIQTAPLGARRLTVPPLLRLACGWGLPVAWAALCEVLLERKNRPPFRCWMVYGRPQYAAEMVGLVASFLLMSTRMGALLRSGQVPQRWAPVDGSPPAARDRRPMLGRIDSRADLLDEEMEKEMEEAVEENKLIAAVKASQRRRQLRAGSDADAAFNDADHMCSVESDPGARTPAHGVCPPPSTAAPSTSPHTRRVARSDAPLVFGPLSQRGASAARVSRRAS